MSQRALGEQFSLYRGEGSHDRPSYYPKTGPNAHAGHWYTSDPKKAHNYASGGNVYKLDVHPNEAKRSGALNNYVVADPAVRARRKEMS